MTSIRPHMVTGRVVEGDVTVDPEGEKARHRV